MFSRFHKRITFKLAVAAALLAMFLGLGLGALEASVDFAQEEESLDALAMRILMVAKPTASRAVVVIDTTLAHEVVQGLLEYDFVSSAQIVDDLGEIMVTESKRSASMAKHWQSALVGSDSRTYSIPLLDASDAYKEPGRLVITVDAVQAFTPFLDRVINQIALTLIQALAFAIGLMVVFYILVTKPLTILARAFDQVSPQEPGKSLLPTTLAQQNNEFGMAARSGNRLLTAIQNLLHERTQAEAKIRDVAEAVSSIAGDNVLQRLVRSFVRILGVDFAYIGTWADDEKSRIRTAVFVTDGAIRDNFEYDLAGSPCENVVGQKTCIYNGNVQRKFPEDRGLANLGAETYIGFPLFSSADEPLGLFAALNRTPIENPEAIGDLLHFFGVRAAAELERQRADDARAEAEERLRSITENVADGMFRTNEEGQLLWANTTLANMAGFENGTQMVSAVTDVASQIYVNPDDRKAILQGLRSEGVVKDFVAQFRRMNTGEILWGSTNCRAIRGSDGKLYIDGVVRDITESRRNEERMRRVEKMQAIGQLTGGIAHDFNNLLGIVIGNLDMVEEDIADDERLGKPVATALRAALRGAELTKRLLGFSRQTGEEAKPINMNVLIGNLYTLLTKSLTAEIEVQTFLSDDLWLTEVNPGDFEDALLNLAINARDAMPEDGTLVIETRNIALESDYGEVGNDIPHGEYVMVSVSDSGCGMQKDVVDRIFEPFFTTKGAGKGTGLGLSLVYGFIQRSNGYIRVYSEPGNGTTIHMYFPRSRQPESEHGASKEQDELLPSGTETVLVVDDEPDLVNFARETLAPLGYRVLVAENAHVAIKELKKYPDTDILFTDVVMPGGMNGLELAEQALSEFPGLKVLVTSGFSEKIPRSNRHAYLLNSQLAKPYRRKDLIRRIRQVLDEEYRVSSRPT